MTFKIPHDETGIHADAQKKMPSRRTLLILLAITGGLSIGGMEFWTVLWEEILDIQINFFHKIMAAYCSAVLFSLLFSGFWICKQRTSRTTIDRYRFLMGAITFLVSVLGLPCVAGALIFLKTIIPESKMDFETLAVLAGCVFLVFFGAWLHRHNLKKLRHISDTPSSKIRSAAQGYVELKGTLTPLPGQPLLKAPLSNTACLWWDYKIKKRWPKIDETIETDRSHDGFCIEDGTGQCQINLHGANIEPHREKEWEVEINQQQLDFAIPLTPLGKPLMAGHYRYIEKLLLPEHELYALGEFRSKNGQHVLAMPDNRRPFILSVGDEAEVIYSTRFNVITGVLLCLVGVIGVVYILWPR